MIQFNKFFQITRNARLVTVLCSSLLVSCGGSITSAGIGGTGITSGEITGFGSVFVNGVEFNTTNSQFEVDGDSYDTQALAITAGLTEGMVAKINGSIDDNGVTGTANTVIYDDDIQGPITILGAPAGNTITFVIYDQTVIVDETSTSFKNTSFSSLQEGDILEVSGFHASSTEIRATYVEKTGDLSLVSPKVELKGTISAYTTTPSESFVLIESGVTINVPSSTVIDVPGNTLINGLFVEVEGIYLDPTSIDASEIEFEDDNFGENVDEISLQGIIADFTNLSTNFTINGQEIDASGALLSPTNAVLDDGVNVEVEGSIVGNILIADEVELRQGSVKIRTYVSSLPINDSFNVSFPPGGSIMVNTDTQTQFEDEAGESPFEDFSLADIDVGDFVRIDAIDNNGQIIATTVKRRDFDDIVLQGRVDSFEANASITILGIIYPVAAGAQYETFVDADEFFAQLQSSQPDQIVEIVDHYPADGFADEVALED